MDKLDAWMKRAFSLEKPEQISSTSKKKSFVKTNTQKETPKKQEEGKQSGKKRRHKKRRPEKSRNQKQENSSGKSQNQGKGGDKRKPRKDFRAKKPQAQNHQAHKPVPKVASKATRKPPVIHKGKIKIIPLGGLNEVGKNMLAIEYENDIVIVDMGFEFPGEDMLGIDYVIPNIEYLKGK